MGFATLYPSYQTTTLTVAMLVRLQVFRRMRVLVGFQLMLGMVMVMLIRIGAMGVRVGVLMDVPMRMVMRVFMGVHHLAVAMFMGMGMGVFMAVNMFVFMLVFMILLHGVLLGLDGAVDRRQHLAMPSVYPA